MSFPLPQPPPIDQHPDHKVAYVASQAQPLTHVELPKAVPSQLLQTKGNKPTKPASPYSYKGSSHSITSHPFQPSKDNIATNVQSTNQVAQLVQQREQSSKTNTPEGSRKGTIASHKRYSF